jgi:diguanylate cyclase (GGDEF)-like protein
MSVGTYPALMPVAARQNVFSFTLIVVIASTIAAALALACAGVYWATHASDEVSVERQARSARHAMEMSVDELAHQQETVAVWDLAAAALAVPQPETFWIHENIGTWLNTVFAHDELFVLNGADRPVYASTAGVQVSLQRYGELAGDLANIRAGVRSNGAVSGRHDRRLFRTSPDSTARTTPRATHDSHLMLLGGRPAAVSAMLVTEVTPGWSKQRGPKPILVSVRYLDAGFLAELSARQLISSPRFSRSRAHSGAEGVVSLRTEGGSVIGFLIWKPELPGTRILWKLVPINLLILIGLAGFMVFLGRRLRDAAAEIEAGEAHSAHLAYHDALTGLPNRALFQLRLDALTSGPDGEGVEGGGEGGGRRFALLLLDVDEFKLTNDTLGHDAGDALLRAFANRLLRSTRSEDMVARLGGDEFGVLLMGMGGPVEVEAFAALMLERLGEPVEHGGKTIHSRASIGASCFAGASSESLLKEADLALYEAKRSGRGAFRFYDASMWSSMQLRGEMLSTASAALDGDFIVPFYQPKIDLTSGAIIGFEALLRCCMPGREPQAPACIAAAFEDSALAVKLSDRMVDGVIRDILTWQTDGLPFGHVAINAALAELRRGDFAERLLLKLRAAGIDPGCIQVEVTESVLLGPSIEHIERTFNELAAAGIKLALDDFGTGFASLTHLKRFPIDIIKIDRSFIRDLQVDAEDGAIVGAVVGLGERCRSRSSPKASRR